MNALKCYGGILGGKKNEWLNFGGDLDHHVDCPIRNPVIIQQIMDVFWWNFQIALQWYEEQLID